MVFPCKCECLLAMAAYDCLYYCYILLYLLCYSVFILLSFTSNPFYGVCKSCFEKKDFLKSKYFQYNC